MERLNNQENKTSRIDGTIHHQKWQNVTVTVVNICNFCVGRHFQTHFWWSTFWLVSTVGNSQCKPHFFLENFRDYLFSRFSGPCESRENFSFAKISRFTVSPSHLIWPHISSFMLNKFRVEVCCNSLHQNFETKKWTEVLTCPEWLDLLKEYYESADFIISIQRTKE